MTSTASLRSPVCNELCACARTAVTSASCLAMSMTSALGSCSCNQGQVNYISDIMKGKETNLFKCLVVLALEH